MIEKNPRFNFIAQPLKLVGDFTILYEPTFRLNNVSSERTSNKNKQKQVFLESATR